MSPRAWTERYSDKITTAQEALERIRYGQTVYIGTGAGEPFLLTETLAAMAGKVADIELIHLMSARDEAPFSSPRLRRSFRYKTFYTGLAPSPDAAAAEADYTPMAVSQLPAALAEGLVRVDVALVQVTPPDEYGYCSLGVSVDATKAVVEHASLVIAQVNSEMPVTLGDSQVPIESLDLLVQGDQPLPEFPSATLDPISVTIGRHVADLIGDGCTLHFDGGPVSAATMRYLDTRKDLGIHTDILTDDMLRLLKSRAVTNRRKTIDKGKTVVTMALGSKELYDAVSMNPFIEFHPIEQVDDPFVIARNDRMMSVVSVEEIELTGLARAGTEYSSNVRRLPTGVDFMDGARRSKSGLAILVLPSTTPDGQQSRILPISIRRGAAIPRDKVDYVVTEYGRASLYGRSIRERAISLISIAHPKFRAQLLEEAKALGYVGADQPIAPEHGSVYPHHYEFTHKFSDGLEVLFRPVKPCDAQRLQRLFYSFSQESLRLRYHGTTKILSDQMAQKLAAVDYSQDVSIVALVGRRRNPTIIAEGRCTHDPGNNMGEFDIAVHEDYRKRGIAVILADYLRKIAYARGLSGMYAVVIQQNRGTMALLDKAWPTATKSFESGTRVYTVRFPGSETAYPKDSVFIYSGRFADYTYGTQHPFDPERARSTLKLIRQQGHLNEPWTRVEEPQLVHAQRLTESHEPAFIEALRLANDGKWRDELVRFGLGGDDCPVFPGLFDYVLLYASATLTGVELIMNQKTNIVFNPIGGFHHASRSHAEGFCYVNDVIVAIDALVGSGHRVAYIDIDAHHGNGVQDAYWRDDRVLVVSLHESGKTLYPGTGFETEIGEDMGRGFTINIPLPVNTDDEAYVDIFDSIVDPAVKRFSPSVVVAVVGADTHRTDPLSNLSLTINGMVSAMERIREWCPHLLMLGGGGYNPRMVNRAWCRMWAAANRIDALPDFLSVVGGNFLGAEGLQGAELADMQYRVTGEEKKQIIAELDRIVEFHEANTLPLLPS